MAPAQTLSTPADFSPPCCGRPVIVLTPQREQTFDTLSDEVAFTEGLYLEFDRSVTVVSALWSLITTGYLINTVTKLYT